MGVVDMSDSFEVYLAKRGERLEMRARLEAKQTVMRLLMAQIDRQQKKISQLHRELDKERKAKDKLSRRLRALRRIVKWGIAP